MAGLLPALLLALFGTWCGTFAWGAAAPASTAAAVLLLGTLSWIGAPWRDPLRLGTAGCLPPGAALVPPPAFPRGPPRAPARPRANSLFTRLFCPPACLGALSAPPPGR